MGAVCREKLLRGICPPTPDILQLIAPSPAHPRRLHALWAFCFSSLFLTGRRGLVTDQSWKTCVRLLEGMTDIRSREVRPNVRALKQTCIDPASTLRRGHSRWRRRAEQYQIKSKSVKSNRRPHTVHYTGHTNTE